MERRQTLGALVGLIGGAALNQAAVSAQPADPRAFTVHSGCSGWIIVQNGPQDFTLRLVSGDGSASIKYLRLTGPDAFAELQDIWRTLMFQSQKFGVPFIT
jgi:hypothetical protein